MMKASAMTMKVVAALFIAIIKQCRYYNCTGYKFLVFKFIAKKKTQILFKLYTMGASGPLGHLVEYGTV